MLDKAEIIKDAKEIIKKSGKKSLSDKSTQLSNLREMARKDIPIEEFILYLEYQAARKQLPSEFVENVKNYLKKDAFKKGDEGRKLFQYFIGNLVRAGMVVIKGGEL